MLICTSAMRMTSKMTATDQPIKQQAVERHDRTDQALAAAGDHVAVSERRIVLEREFERFDIREP